MPVLETALFYAATFPISPTVFAGKFLHDKWRSRDGVFEESHSARLLRTARASAASRTRDAARLPEETASDAASSGTTGAAATVEARASDSDARVEAIDAEDDQGWAQVVAMLQLELRRHIEAAHQVVRKQRCQQQAQWRGVDGVPAPASLHAACAGLAALAAWLVHVNRPAGGSDDSAAAISSGGAGGAVRGIIDSGAERAELDAAVVVGEVLIESLCASCRADGGHCFVVRRGTSSAGTQSETDTESTTGADDAARYMDVGVASAPAEGRLRVRGRSSSRSVVATAVSDGEPRVASQRDGDMHVSTGAGPSAGSDAGVSAGGDSTVTTTRDNAILGAMLLMPPPLERRKVDVVEDSDAHAHAHKDADHKARAGARESRSSRGTSDGGGDIEDIISHAVHTALLHFAVHGTKAPNAGFKGSVAPHLPPGQCVGGSTHPPAATAPKVSKLKLRRREPLSPSSGPAATVGALRSLHAARARFARRRLEELRQVTAAMSRLGEAMWDGSWQILLLGACPDATASVEHNADTAVQRDAGTEQLMPEAARWLLRAFAAIVDCPSRPPPPPSAKPAASSTVSTSAELDSRNTVSGPTVSDSSSAPPGGVAAPSAPAPGRLLLPFSVVLPVSSMSVGERGFEFREEDDVGFEIFQRRELGDNADAGNTSDDDDDSRDILGDCHSSGLPLVALVRAPRRFVQERQRATSSVSDQMMPHRKTADVSAASTQREQDITNRGIGLAATEALPPLLAAAAENDLLMLRVLLNAGFPPDSISCVDASGRSALAVAAHAGHEEVVTVLLDAVRLCPDVESGSAPSEASGDARLRRWVDLRDVTGHTALQHARKCGHAGVAALLVAAGATEASSSNSSMFKAQVTLDESSEEQLSDRRGFRVPRVVARDRGSNACSGPSSSVGSKEELEAGVGIAAGMRCTTYPSVRNADIGMAASSPQILSSPGFRHPNHHRRAFSGALQGDAGRRLGAALEQVANARGVHRRRNTATDGSPILVRAHSLSAPVSPGFSPPSAGRELGINACFRASKGAELARSPFDARAAGTRVENARPRVTEPQSARLPYRYQKQERRRRQQSTAPSTPLVSALLGGR